MPSPRCWHQGRAERWSLRSLIIYRLPPLKPPLRKLRGRFRGSAQNCGRGLRTEKARTHIYSFHSSDSDWPIDRSSWRGFVGACSLVGRCAGVLGDARSALASPSRSAIGDARGGALRLHHRYLSSAAARARGIGRPSPLNVHRTSPPSTLPHGRAAKESGFALHRAPIQPESPGLPKVALGIQAEARTQPPPCRGPLEIGRSAGFYRLTLRACAGWGQGWRSASVVRAGRYAPRPLGRRSRLRVSREHPPLRFG